MGSRAWEIWMHAGLLWRACGQPDDALGPVPPQPPLPAAHDAHAPPGQPTPVPDAQLGRAGGAHQRARGQDRGSHRQGGRDHHVPEDPCGRQDPHLWARHVHPRNQGQRGAFWSTITTALALPDIPAQNRALHRGWPFDCVTPTWRPSAKGSCLCSHSLQPCQGPAWCPAAHAGDSDRHTRGSPPGQAINSPKGAPVRWPTRQAMSQAKLWVTQGHRASKCRVMPQESKASNPGQGSPLAGWWEDGLDRCVCFVQRAHTAPSAIGF